MSALGKLNNGNRDGLKGGRNAVAVNGGTNTVTPWRGLGAKMVDDLGEVQAKYDRVKKVERPDYVSDQIEALQEERDLKAFKNLDSLLDDILA